MKHFTDVDADGIAIFPTKGYDTVEIAAYFWSAPRLVHRHSIIRAIRAEATTEG